MSFIITILHKSKLRSLDFLFPFYFLNYENMTTHLQDTWKIQKKVTYSPTMYYNYF